MNDSNFKLRNFDNPSIFFRFEDKFKWFLMGPLIYNPYFKKLGLKGNEHVLDFGSGGGVGSRGILKNLNGNGHLTCVDSSIYWINKSSSRLKKFGNVNFRHGDIRKLNIPSSSIDVISIIHVLHDIPPNDRQSTVFALVKTLKKTGIFCIVEPTRTSHGMPVSEIRELLLRVGLKETECIIKKSRYQGKFRFET